MRQLVHVCHGCSEEPETDARVARFVARALERAGASLQRIDTHSQQLTPLAKPFYLLESGTAPTAWEEVASAIVKADAFVVVARIHAGELDARTLGFLANFAPDCARRPLALISWSTDQDSKQPPWRESIAQQGLVSIPSSLHLHQAGEAIDEQGNPARADSSPAIATLVGELLWYGAALEQARQEVID